MQQCFRIWKIFDVDEVSRHLMIMGDLAADCANCKELGLDPWKSKACPKCHTPFRFFASRRTANHPGERFHLARRVMESRPDLQMIDYDDYQKAIGHQKVKDFFKT